MAWWKWWRKDDDELNGGSGRDFLFGWGGNDTIRGGGGNDWLFGNRGNDLVYGEDGNDLVSGGKGNDIVDGGDGRDIVLGGRGNDEVRGGKGGDWVHAGSGDDTGFYNISDHLNQDTSHSWRSWDTYNGGRGTDHLVLEISEKDSLRSDVQADIARFKDFLDGGSHGWCWWGYHARTFKFESLKLKVKNWETFEVVITNKDESNDGPVAHDDEISEGFTPIPEEESNDFDDADPTFGAQDDIFRSSFRIAPTKNVGNDSLPRVAITGIINELGDNDVYAIQLLKDEILILDIDDTTLPDPDPAPDTFINLLNSSGVSVASNDDIPSDWDTIGGAGSNSRVDPYLEYMAPEDGIYYVFVGVYFSNSVGPYTLNVSIAPTEGNPTNLGAFEILADTLLNNDDPALVKIVSVQNEINGDARLTGDGNVDLLPDNPNFASSFEYTAVDDLDNEATARATFNGHSVDGTDGNDTLFSTTENDLFNGGAGNDVFTAGDGNDAFVFGQGDGDNQIHQFTVGTDALILTEGLTISSIEQQNGDSLVNFESGGSPDGSVVLIGVPGVTEEDILA